MAKIESGKVTLDEACCNVYTFNDSLFSMFDPQMKEKGIRCTRTCRVEHTDVICDETKLREVFLNILSNSWITVTLPHRIAEAEHVTHHTQATARHETELFKGKRLLLAEDNELNAELPNPNQ